MTSVTLPYRTPDLPGIGGRIKVEPEDFFVEEIPAYLPSGEGEHLFLWIEKRDISHEFLLRHLAQELGVSPRDVGTAGIKDRRAITRQWISVPRSCEDRLAQLERELENLRILDVRPHGNKLRTGHLVGNRFRIVIREVGPDAKPAAQAIARRLRHVGFANYYGAQRFGREGKTLRTGWEYLSGAKRPRRRDSRLRLELSALQSYLFNEALRQRIDDDLLDRVLLGDVMQVVASGGLFLVEEVAAEAERAQTGQTVVTGPIFGPKMKRPAGEVFEREQRVLHQIGLEETAFERFRKLTRGTRRPYLVRPSELEVTDSPDGLCVHLILPPGSYATVVLRELMKVGADETLGHFEPGSLRSLK